MSFVTNIPETREERIRRNLGLYQKLEAKADAAKEAGDEETARMWYERADNVYALVEDDRRQERREAAARVANMKIRDVLTGPAGSSVLD